MMQPENPRQSGFTLVEMMVALAIFSMISVAGVALLRSASDTQLVVKDRLAELGGEARAAGLIEADLAQAIARPVRTNSGTIEPAFVAGGTELPGQLFALTRAGSSNLDDSPRAELQRVVYAFDNAMLKRRGAAMPDGAAANASVLLSNIASASVRYRDGQGNWRSDWDATDPLAMPRAVELLLTPQGGAPRRMLFLVGVALPAKAVPEGGDGAAP
jgi:general secretion pathway protein J